MTVSRKQRLWPLPILVICHFALVGSAAPPVLLHSLDQPGEESCGVQNVVYSSQGKELAAILENGSVVQWDVTTRKVRGTFQIASRSVTAIAYQPTLAQLACGMANGDIVVLNSKTMRVEMTLKGHEGAVAALGYSSNGKLLASGGKDKSVKIWSSRGVCTATLLGHRDGVTAVAFAKKNLLVTGSFDSSIIVWDTLTGKKINRFADGPAYILALAISPDGKTAVSGSGSLKKNAQLRLWTIESGKYTVLAQGKDRWFQSVSFSPDGTIVAASCGLQNTIGFWRLDRKKQVAVIDRHGAGSCIAFSPDGVSFASGSGDYKLYIWDIKRILRK